MIAVVAPSLGWYLYLIIDHKIFIHCLVLSVHLMSALHSICRGDPLSVHNGHHSINHFQM